jgi:hypothetical protein
MTSHLTVAWRKAKIRDLLSGGNMMNATELANALDEPVSTVRSTLERKMVGEVEKVGTQYRLKAR